MLSIVKDLVDDPDADIISGLAAGNEKALKQLMDRHLSKIHALAYYMVGDQMTAEDITQTVFLKTWSQAANWEPGKAQLLTWMRRVATNACLDYLRKKKPVYTDKLPEKIDDRNNPYENLSAKDTANRVQIAIGQLPDRQRAALTLSYYQGVTQKDGAQILDISQSAYESLLVRARKTLKTLLEPQKDELEMGQRI